MNELVDRTVLVRVGPEEDEAEAELETIMDVVPCVDTEDEGEGVVVEVTRSVDEVFTVVVPLLELVVVDFRVEKEVL